MDGINGKKFQESSEQLDGERRQERILEDVWTKGSFYEVKMVCIQDTVGDVERIRIPRLSHPIIAKSCLTEETKLMLNRDFLYRQML